MLLRWARTYGGALHTIGENADHIKQGLARLKGLDSA